MGFFCFFSGGGLFCVGCLFLALWGVNSEPFLPCILSSSPLCPTREKKGGPPLCQKGCIESPSPWLHHPLFVRKKKGKAYPPLLALQGGNSASNRPHSPSNQLCYPLPARKGRERKETASFFPLALTKSRDQQNCRNMIGRKGKKRGSPRWTAS